MSFPGVLDKREFRYIPYPACPAVQFGGNWVHKPGHAIGLDPSAGLSLRLENVTCVYGLFSRHDWSGKICISVNRQDRDCFDLYSPYPFDQCIPLCASGPRSVFNIQIRNLGMNVYSRSCQVVFRGLLLRTEEVAETAIGRPAAAPPGQSLCPPQDRELFEDLQTHMVDRYRERVVQQGESLEAHSRQRWARYTLRYREALVYIGPGARLLDIGGGFLTEDFLRQVILPAQIDYWVHDIDRRAIEHDRAAFVACGINPEHASQGTNTALPSGSGCFDLVFSSHCLEHSDDIQTTFSELHRVTKPGGVLFFAVPFGYDDSAEHTYAIDIAGWRALTAAHGFEVINEHVGNVYREDCRDLAIVARKR